jgi:hypothetical protein
MKRTKTIVALAVVSLLGLSAATANASYGAGAYWYEYPGSTCAVFNGQGMVAPNGGPELVNFSSSNTALVECSVQRDPYLLNVSHSTYVTVRGGTSCVFRTQQRNGAQGWVLQQDQINTPQGAGFSELWWGERDTDDQYSAATIECLMPPGSALNSYRTYSQYMWD